MDILSRLCDTKILKRPLTDAEEMTHVYPSKYKNIIFLPIGEFRILPHRSIILHCDERKSKQKKVQNLHE